MAIDVGKSESSSEVSGNVNNYAADEGVGEVAVGMGSMSAAGMGNGEDAASDADSESSKDTESESVSGVSDDNAAVADRYPDLGGNSDRSTIDMRYGDSSLPHSLSEPLDASDDSVVDAASVSTVAGYDVTVGGNNGGIEVIVDVGYAGNVGASM